MAWQGAKDTRSPVGQPLFVTTHWSLLLAAADQETPGAAAALDRLCLTYWRPIYIYLRRRGCGPEDAEDFTQQFLSEFLQKGSFELADPARGRFRTFLLTSLQHFLSDQWKRAHRVKRGGGTLTISLHEREVEESYCEGLAETLTPERAYERRWAMTLLKEVLAAMQRDYEQAGKARHFEALQGFLWGVAAPDSYAHLAAALGLSEGTARVAVHRFREQYRQRLRAHVAQLVSEPALIDEEIRYLIEVVSH